MRQKDKANEFFDKLTLANDFVFKMVLENEAICKKLIEMVLGKPVSRVVSLETEKTLSEGFFSHSVCFDVYVEGSDEVIDFEIQCSSIKSIEKRAREYQGNLDVEQLSKGKAYSSLKESWIVFFCTFDPFKLGIPVYTVRQTYEEAKEAKYDDGTHKVFYNCTAWDKCTDKEMRAFLKLVMGLEAETEYTRQIVHVMHSSLKREDVRRNVMRLQEIIDQRVEEKLDQYVEENKMLWLAQGDTQGFDKGMAQGSRDTKIATARNLLAMGLSVQQTAQAVDLPLDEVKALL